MFSTHPEAFIHKETSPTDNDSHSTYSHWLQLEVESLTFNIHSNASPVWWIDALTACPLTYWVCVCALNTWHWSSARMTLGAFTYLHKMLFKIDVTITEHIWSMQKDSLRVYRRGRVRYCEELKRQVESCPKIVRLTRVPPRQSLNIHGVS